MSDRLSKAYDACEIGSKDPHDNVTGILPSHPECHSEHSGKNPGSDEEEEKLIPPIVRLDYKANWLQKVVVGKDNLHAGLEMAYQMADYTREVGNEMLSVTTAGIVQLAERLTVLEKALSPIVCMCKTSLCIMALIDSFRCCVSPRNH